MSRNLQRWRRANSVTAPSSYCRAQQPARTGSSPPPSRTEPTFLEAGRASERQLDAEVSPSTDQTTEGGQEISAGIAQFIINEEAATGQCRDFRFGAFDCLASRGPPGVPRLDLGRTAHQTGSLVRGGKPASKPTKTDLLTRALTLGVDHPPEAGLPKARLFNAAMHHAVAAIGATVEGAS